MSGLLIDDCRCALVGGAAGDLVRLFSHRGTKARGTGWRGGQLVLAWLRGFVGILDLEGEGSRGGAAAAPACVRDKPRR